MNEWAEPGMGSWKLSGGPGSQGRGVPWSGLLAVQGAVVRSVRVQERWLRKGLSQVLESRNST